MGNLLTIGSGGAGIGIANDLVRWCRNKFGRRLRGDIRNGVWLYGDREDEELYFGYGAYILDANSSDLQSAEKEFKGRKYRISAVEGYGGNWKKAYDELISRKSDMVKMRMVERREGEPLDWEIPELVSRPQEDLLEILESYHSFASTHATPIFSMDGGAGSGSFRFLCDNRDKIVEPDVTFTPVAIMPSINEMARESRRKSTEDTLDYLLDKKQNGDIDYSLVVCNDMALLQYARLQGSVSEQNVYEINVSIDRSLGNNDYKSLVRTLSGSRDYLAKITGLKAVNPLIVACTLPQIIAACKENFVEKVETEPKTVDSADLRSVGDAAFVIPSYNHINETKEELDNRFGEGMGLPMWIEHTISNMLIPSYTRYDKMSDVLSGLIIFIWGKKGVSRADLSYISNDIKGNYDVELEAYSIAGKDPLEARGFDILTKTGPIYRGLAPMRTGPEYRAWVLAKTNDKEFLKSKIYGSKEIA